MTHEGTPSGRMRPGVISALLSVVAVVVAVVGLGARPASAHAQLISTDPVADSVIPSSPAQLVLRFSEPVDPLPDGIRLLTGTGERVEVGRSGAAGSDATTVAIDLPELQDGSYVASWQVVSADSHTIRGAFTFAVGAVSGNTSAVLTDALDDSSTSSTAGGLLAIGRALSYGGVAVLIGGLGLLVSCWPAGVASRSMTRLLWVGVGAGVLGTAAMIAAQAAETVGRTGAAWDLNAWATVLDTRAGRWWGIRLAAIAVVGAIAVLARVHLVARRSWAVLAGVVGAAGLAVVAAGGHAVSGRVVVVGFLATVAHLAAMAAWVGGVAAIALVVPRDQLAAAARRFSPLAFAAVVTLVLSGVVNGIRQVGSWSDLTTSSYGRLLLVKSGLVVAVVVAAAASRAAVRGRVLGGATTTLAAGAAVGPGASPRLGVLTRALGVEVAGFVAVLAVTAVLVNTSPAVADTPSSVAVSAVQGDSFVDVSLAPASTEGGTLHVSVTSPGGALEVADEITVRATLPARDVGPIEVPVFPSGPNHVTALDARLPLAGTWSLEIRARYGEFDEVVFRVDVPVSD